MNDEPQYLGEPILPEIQAPRRVARMTEEERAQALPGQDLIVLRIFHEILRLGLLDEQNPEDWTLRSSYRGSRLKAQGILDPLSIVSLYRFFSQTAG
jgi:hypothetical protein